MIRADVSFKFKCESRTFLVITGSIASQLEDFGCEILKDGSKVDWTRISHASITRWKSATYQVHLHQLVGRSCPCGGDGGHDQQEMQDQLSPIEIGSFCQLQLFRQIFRQT